MRFLACIICGVYLFLVSSCAKEYGFNFENGFNSGEYEDTVTVNVDTNRFKIDYSRYNQARMFPGLMNADEPRLENFVVTIDLNYEDIRSMDLRISVAPGNWQSTGVYAPAGELIVMDVPAGVYGLTAQIGAHVYNSAQGIDFPQRDLNITERQTLFPGRNYMRNLYGGLVYILPSRPLGRTVDITFSGVAKAASFKLGETTNAEWQEMVQKTSVPWFELEGRRVVLALETKRLSKFPIEDPTVLMETWDDMIRRGYWDWTGMAEGNPDIRHRAPFNKWRIVHDVLFAPGVGMVSGYPIRSNNGESSFTAQTELEEIKFGNWGAYHEIGHNMQMGSTWSFDGNGEVTCNLFSLKVSMLNGRQSYKIAEVWSSAVPYIAAVKSREVGADKINWAGMDIQNNPYASERHNIRLMMYAQIFERYGYEFMTYIYKKAREARFTSANDQSKIDFFYESLSEFTGIDMEPYLTIGWGVFPSTISKRQVSETLRLPLLNKNVWKFDPLTRTGGDEDFDTSPYNKMLWKVTASSNDAGDGGGPGALIDNNPSTYWHTPWRGTIPPWPHHFTLEFPQSIDIAAVKLYNRHNTAADAPKDFKIQTSIDGETFTDVSGVFEMVSGNGASAEFRLPSNVNSRYLRVLLLNGKAGRGYTNLAEIDIIKP
ncbi:M60 family metallopeptidase [Sphingobacterium deserti]|uniref:Peptidase M60 domain-containing protein n=1 Tax=Sphingobacterium deserti TaxID=1229276 RepID=A0A0B8T5B9_9SPHI|nr:M60 family metallopeptidase [Sphingobacterium deserti]KGE15668.1 hypothetical protein DI53_0590 [Sphingobacterium deserti]